MTYSDDLIVLEVTFISGRPLWVTPNKGHGVTFHFALAVPALLGKRTEGNRGFPLMPSPPPTCLFNRPELAEARHSGRKFNGPDGSRDALTGGCETFDGDGRRHDSHRAQFAQPLLYSSWRRIQTPVSLRPLGARSSHWYTPQRPSSPRA